MLWSWSKSFSRRACRENFPCCWWSASSKTNFHLRPTARVYELNLNWHTLKIFLPALNWASDLKLWILSVKMRRIAVLVQVVVVILFRRHASDKFQRAISWTITWIFLLNCLSLKYVLSDHFQWSNQFQFIKINWKCVFIWIKFAHGTDVWNSLSSASVAHLFAVFENCSIRLSNDWNNFYETTDHLQQFRTDK